MSDQPQNRTIKYVMYKQYTNEKKTYTQILLKYI
jgi:hypothetical protein